MIRRLALVVVAALGLCACDGQQYVSPDTVLLTVSNDETGIMRVNRCNYVPVLLGSEVKARYGVEDDIKVTITITREEVEVAFQDPNRDHDPFVVAAEDFEDNDSGVDIDDTPAGYTARLSSGCTPDED